MPSRAAKLRPASFIACAMIRLSASTCARAAISGTTPPNAACSSICDSTTLDRMRPGPLPGRSTTAAAVSSHVVSMPSTTIADPHPLVLISPRLERRYSPAKRDEGPPGRVCPPPPCGGGLGGGVVVGARHASANCYPHPQPLPTRGEGSTPRSRQQLDRQRDL